MSKPWLPVKPAFLNRRPWNILFPIVMFFLTPLVLLYASQVVWLGTISAPFTWAAAYPGAVLLFCFVYMILELALWGLTRSIYLGNYVQLCVLMGVAVTSRYKMIVNGAPFLLSDFRMTGQMGTLMGYAGSHMIPECSMILGVAIAVLWAKFLHKKETWYPPCIPSRIVGAVFAALTVVLLLVPNPLQTKALALTDGASDSVERVGRTGPILLLYTSYCQGVHLENMLEEANINAMAEEFQSRDETITPLPLEQTPDIIWVTSESFFDITRLENLSFEEDPLPTFHSLAAFCTNGRMISNTYGGGTGNVEMSFFTALSSEYMKEGDTLTDLPTETYERLPNFVRLLGQYGYATTALHAYNDELYNRAENYPALGFDTVAFDEDYITKLKYKGPYPSNESFAQEIIARYEERDETIPFFLYGMDMENHQAYAAGKFTRSSGYPAESERLDKRGLANLDALVMGLHDADTELGILVDYFSKVDRPVLLIFVGDHLPSIFTSDGTTTLFSALGVSNTDDSINWTAQETMDRLSTDYVIWSNYETESAPDRTENCTFLSLRLLERAGIPMSSWFQWLREEITPPVLAHRGKLYVNYNGESSFTVPEDVEPILDTYAAVERSMLYNKPSD